MEPLLSRLRSQGTWMLELRRDEVVKVDAPTTLQVIEGRAWITIDGEPDDWFVAAGERFVIEPGQLALVQADPTCSLAVLPAAVRLRTTGSQAQPVQPAWAVLRSALRGWPTRLSA